MIKVLSEVIRFYCPNVGWKAFSKLSPYALKCIKANRRLIGILTGLTLAYLHVNFGFNLGTKIGVTFRINQEHTVRCEAC